MNKPTLPPCLTEVLVAYRPMIEAALRYGGFDHTFDDVASRVLSGKAYFFCNETACAVCEVVRFSQASSFHVWLAGGTLEGVLALTPEAEEVAKQLNCNRLTLTGRKGFARALQPHGWNHTHVTMERAVSARTHVKHHI